MEAEQASPDPARRSCAGRTASRPMRPSGAREPIVDTAIPYDAVWDCVTCGACVEACPVVIEHVDKIVGLRRNLVLEECRFPAELNGRLHGHGAARQPVGPAGQPTRLDWTQGLPFEVPTAAQLAADRTRSASSRSSTGSAARRRSMSATGASPARS